MSDDLETAKQLLALAQRYIDKGEAAKAAQVLSQAEQIVTEVVKGETREKPKSN